MLRKLALPLCLLLGLAPHELRAVSPAEPIRVFAAAEASRPEQALMRIRAGVEGIAGLDLRIGQALFERLWVSSPSSTRAADGLGPLYNARSCAACHENLGRGHPPETGLAPAALVVRLAGPGGAPDPRLGRQIQSFSVPGLNAEARVALAWEVSPVMLADGTEVELRAPRLTLSDFGWGPPAPDTRLAARIAPALVGLGDIAAIPDAEILANAASGQASVRGRVRMVAPLDGSAPRPGRFGRRAGFSSLEDATIGAMAMDMGLSTPLAPEPWGDCTPAQAACRAAPHGDGDARVHEATAQVVTLTADYLAALAPPARRESPEAARGEALFAQIGCATCHRPAYSIDTPEGPRRITPYSDFLLHDLGPGLAETAPETGLRPGEWRTAPLWGLGLVRAVGEGRESYLHDGRARTLLEAMLWHGGSAAPARARVIDLPEPDRAALLAFLESL